ncbi:MAG: molybdopterin-dependent oxidoreductase [Desulfobacterales bacterium]|nr:molybdopterin-dependent oxidoreductase [Desulfobacterales bacterium]
MAQHFSRRAFLAWLGRLMAWSVAAASMAWTPLSKAWAAVKRKLLPATTTREALAKMAPPLIDAGQIPPTPLAQFGVMGTDDEAIDFALWRLTIGGNVATPLRLTYAELLARPAVERKLPLICPMVFANQGVWKGCAIWPLLLKAGVSADARELVASGADGVAATQRRFPLDAVRAEKAYLCYAVNGQPLPVQHGFPLRIVAEEEFGDQWLKYVFKLEVI